MMADLELIHLHKGYMNLRTLLDGLRDGKYYVHEYTINANTTMTVRIVVDDKPIKRLRAIVPYRVVEAKVVAHDPKSYTEKIEYSGYIICKGKLNTKYLDNYLVLHDKILAEKVCEMLNEEARK
jgi:hypothetical protein